MKLITEANFDRIESKVEIVECGVPGNPTQKSYYIVGITLAANQKNKNGRIYPDHLIEREVARYTRDYIDQNGALGELGHPEGPTINLDRASHKFVSLHREGDNWISKAKVLVEQEMGRKVAGFINEGVRLGISSRGVGSIRNVNGVDVVQDDYYLATAGDIVHDPSAPNAFVNGIMEGKEWAWESGPGSLLKESVIAGYKQIIVESSSKNLENARLKVFEDFMRRISKK